MADSWIFGYGSLINSDSLAKDTSRQVANAAIPVAVKKLRRGWWARGTSRTYNTTFLGAIGTNTSDDWINGVLFKVDEGQFANLDYRESQADMDRRKICLEDIDFERYGQSPLETQEDIWVYVNKLSMQQALQQVPSKNYPMVQSYIDICVGGTVQVNARLRNPIMFIDDFLETTIGWNRFWVNDRIHPRRAFANQPLAGDIDLILSSDPRTKDYFYEMELEPACWSNKNPLPPSES